MKKFFTFLFIITLLSIAALAISIPSLNKALTNNEFRNHLLDRLASAMDGKLEATAVSIVLDQKSIHISCKNLKGELLNTALSLDIPDGRISIPYTSLLKGSLFPDSLQAISPRISYKNPPNTTVTGTSNIGNWSRSFNNLLNRLSGSAAQIDISNGTFELGPIAFTGIFMKTRGENPGLTSWDLSMDMVYDDSIIPLQLTGNSNNSCAGPFGCAFDVQAKSLPLRLVPDSRDFFFSGGTADFTGKLGSKGKGLHLDGTFQIKDLDMTVGWTSDDATIHQEKKYRIARSSLIIQADLQGQKFIFPSFDLRSDTFHLLGSFLLDLDNISNPFMDLRLRTGEMALSTLKMLLPDPLINDWTTRTIFPRLENGTGEITRLVLAGTMEEMGRLDEPEYAHCLSWSGILHNVDTFYNDHKFLARVHRSLLSMDGDVLTIKEVTGKSGASILNHGNTTITNLYDPVSILTTDIQGSFSLAWLTTLIKAGLIAEDMQQLLHPVSRVSGQVNGSLELSVGLQKKLVLKFLKGKGVANNMELLFTDIPLPIKIKKADFSLAYPGTSVITGKGSWGKTTFDGSLNLVDLDKKQKAQLKVVADISELKEALTENTMLHSLAPCISKLPLQAVFTEQHGTFSSNGTIDFSRFIPLDTSVCKRRVAENTLLQTEYALELSNNVLNLKKLVLQAEKGTFKIQGRVQTDRKTPLSVNDMRLRAVNFPVQSFVLLVPEQDEILNGTLNTDLQSDSFSLHNIWQSITRNISGSLLISNWQGLLTEGLRVNSMDLITLTIDNEGISLLGKNIRLADFNPETPFELRVNVQKNDALNGTVLLYGKSLDITNLPGLLTRHKTKIEVPLSIGRIDFFVGCDQVHFRNLDFSPLLLEGRVVSDRFILSRYLLQQDDSFVWLTGYPQDDAIIYQSFFKITEKPVGSWMELLGFENNVITGTLNLQGKLTASITPGSIILEKAFGPLYVEIKDGTLSSSSTLVKLLDIISLENVFDKKDVLQWKDSFHFDLLQGRFDLNQGIFSTNSLIMDSPAFDLFAEGTINVVQKTVDMQLKMAPFGTISKLFGFIPYLGYVLTGKSGGLIDYLFSVKGKFGSLNVQYTPLKGTLDSLFGYVKRLVSEREKIKKEVNDFIKIDMIRQKIFKEDMKKKLAPLRSKGKQSGANTIRK